MISGTITDRSGRTLSGQTAEAFWYSLRHARPLSIGLNCALGAKDLRPHVDVLAAGRRHARQLPSERRPAECLRRLRRNARRKWPAMLREFADAGLLNLVGGCCGTTPAHIGAIADAVAGLPPRAIPRLADAA